MTARERAERSMLAGGLDAVTVERAMACLGAEGLAVVDAAWLATVEQSAPEEPAAGQPPAVGTERFPVTGPLAELWSEQLGRGRVDPPSSL